MAIQSTVIFEETPFLSVLAFEDSFKMKTKRMAANEGLNKNLSENKVQCLYNIPGNLVQYIFSICEVKKKYLTKILIFQKFKQGNFELKYQQTTKNMILYTIREYLQRLNE